MNRGRRVASGAVLGLVLGGGDPGLGPEGSGGYLGDRCGGSTMVSSTGWRCSMIRGDSGGWVCSQDPRRAVGRSEVDLDRGEGQGGGQGYISGIGKNTPSAGQVG